MNNNSSVSVAYRWPSEIITLTFVVQGDGSKFRICGHSKRRSLPAKLGLLSGRLVSSSKS